MAIPLSYSVRNLWTRKLTTILTTGGIALVVFVFAAVLMLASGLQQTLVGTGRDDNILVIRKASTTETISSIEREQAAVIRTFPEIAMGPGDRPLISTELSVIINLFKFGSQDMGNVIVRGVTPEALVLRTQVRLVEGRMFRLGSNEVIVGSAIHGRFEGAGIGEYLKFGGRQWLITGVFDAGKSGFDSEIWGDVDMLLPAFGRPVYSALTFRLGDLNGLEAMRARMAADPRLQQLELKRERVFYAEQSEMMATFIRVVGLVITIIFSFGAMVGAMITMYAAVANRTTEIGTLRALGFGRGAVLVAFLAESLFISLLGGGVGVLLASGLQFISISTINFGSFSELAFGFQLTPGIVIGSLIFAISMGLVGGVLPAVRASRLSILAALRAS